MKEKKTGKGFIDACLPQVIFEGEIGDKWAFNGMFNTPYFDQEMKTNFTVQVKFPQLCRCNISNFRLHYSICIRYKYKALQS